MPRLTARLLSQLKPGDLVRDDLVRGLFASVGPTGSISLKLQVDVPVARASGRPRATLRRTLGRFPALTLDEARAEAVRLIAEARAGRDPRTSAVLAPEAWTVGRAFERYVEDLAKRPGSERSQADMRDRLRRYLADWHALPLASLTRELVERRQADVAAGIRARARSSRATGARTANAVVKDLAAVWTFAEGFAPLPRNPARSVTMIGEVREHHEVPIAELRAWWAAVGKIKNPSRRAMHRLGLLSGLRPGNLTSIERAWLRPDRIDFPAPAMKNRRPFTLPLSRAMASIVDEAKHAADVFPSPRYLFPTYNVEGNVRHIAVTREKAKALHLRTGHALRHTWKTCARLARLPESTIEILLAHRLGGVRDTYGSLEDQFTMLLEAQEQVSAWILARVTAPV